MFERPLPEELSGREPSLAPWSALGLRPERVLALLEIFADAFRWRREDVTRLRPEDHVWSFYRYYYPKQRWWQRFEVDELEMERLFYGLKKEIPALRETDLHPGVTVGELVRRVAG